MKLKLLQLNIYQGKYIENIIKYVKKEDFDILNFQEVSGNMLSFNKTDCFETLRKRLQYNGELGISWNVKKDKKSYYSNAILFKNSFKIIDKQVIYLKKYREIDTPEKRIFKDDPRCLLSLTLEKNNKKIHLINAHLAWGKTSHDYKHKLAQGRKLYEFMKNIRPPFILSGDFNVTPDSKIIKMLNTCGHNLITENKITNTLNPSEHKFSRLFPPGLAIDFIITDKILNVKKFKVIDNIALSDHFGLYLEFEI